MLPTKDFNLITAIVLIVLFTVIDMLYAQYTIAVTSLKPLKSATISAIMYVMLAQGVISYSHNPWYLIPIAIGCFLGTYIAVRLEANKTTKP